MSTDNPGGSTALRDSATIPPDDIHAFLGDLERSGVITPLQAHLLADQWPHLQEDWASSAYLRSIREHTRAYIDQQRHAEMAGEEQLGRS